MLVRVPTLLAFRDTYPLSLSSAATQVDNIMTTHTPELDSRIKVWDFEKQDWDIGTVLHVAHKNMGYKHAVTELLMDEDSSRREVKLGTKRWQYDPHPGEHISIARKDADGNPNGYRMATVAQVSGPRTSVVFSGNTMEDVLLKHEIWHHVEAI